MLVAEQIYKSKKVLNFWHKLNRVNQKEFNRYQSHFKALYGGVFSNISYQNGIILPVFE